MFTGEPSQTAVGVSVLKSVISGKQDAVLPLIVKFLTVKTFAEEEIFHATTLM